MKLNYFPILLAASIGFISLGQEILWIRVAGFAAQSIPQSFAAVLAIYLFGIAWGAMVGKIICSRYQSLYAISGFILIVSGFLDIVMPIFYGGVAQTLFGYPVLAAAIFLTAFSKSILFPIAHHLGSIGAGDQIGKKVSRVYFFNVLGAALGPIVTGFFLLDVLSLQANMFLMGGMTTLVGILCLLKSATKTKLKTAVAIATVSMFIIAAETHLPNLTLLTHIAQATTCKDVKQIVENKHGVIHVCPNEKHGDVVFGGNVYDGMMSVDPISDPNDVKRLIILSAIHPNPKRVLVVGLSGGAWLSVLTHMPGVQHIDVVEINPGYLEVISNYPEISKSLEDSRVHLYIDDGRRWLTRRPDNKYDLIIMNTTVHWRSNATNLLSAEFFNEIKTHLEIDAIVTFNATGSLDAFYTASEVFPFAYQYTNFIYASKSDFKKSANSRRGRENITKMLASLAPNAKPFKIASTLQRIFAIPFETIDEKIQEEGRMPEMVTDRNMITEYKYGKLGTPVQLIDKIWPN